MKTEAEGRKGETGMRGKTRKTRELRREKKRKKENNKKKKVCFFLLSSSIFLSFSFSALILSGNLIESNFKLRKIC